MLSAIKIAAIALLSAPVVQCQYVLVQQDMIWAASNGTTLYNACQSYNGTCSGFFILNDIWYRISHALEDGISDTGNSAVFTNQEASNLANLCNNNNYGAVKQWGTCVANKKTLFINIGAKTTVCEQIKNIQDLYSSLVYALIANNPNSPSVTAFQNCKSQIDSVLNLVRAQFPSPCP